MERLQEELFRTLIATHGRSLHFFVLRRVGTECDAQDIAQEALACAVAALSRFRGDAEFSTWVFGIADHLARNHVARHPRRRHGFESDELLESLPSTWPGPCDCLQHRESLQQLSDALQALPANASEALLLVTVEGLSYAAAALKLGVTPGTVRSRVSRARAAVRLRLNQALLEEL
jgi:RNA polymerase sigma factor (sigma-70 family)